MEEQYLRDIRTLLILERARSLSGEPANARKPEELESVISNGREYVRVKMGASIAMAMEELRNAAAYIAKKDAES